MPVGVPPLFAGSLYERPPSGLSSPSAPCSNIVHAFNTPIAAPECDALRATPSVAVADGFSQPKFFCVTHTPGHLRRRPHLNSTLWSTLPVRQSPPAPPPPRSLLDLPGGIRWPGARGGAADLCGAFPPQRWGPGAAPLRRQRTGHGGGGVWPGACKGLAQPPPPPLHHLLALGKSSANSFLQKWGSVDSDFLVR